MSKNSLRKSIMGLIENSGIQQVEFAKRLKVSQSAVSQWCSENEGIFPRASHINKILDIVHDLDARNEKTTLAKKRRKSLKFFYKVCEDPIAEVTNLEKFVNNYKNFKQVLVEDNMLNVFLKLSSISYEKSRIFIKEIESLCAII